MGSDTLGRMLGPGGQIGDVQGGGSSSGAAIEGAPHRPPVVDRVGSRKA